MSHKIADLYALTDEQVIAAHDAAAEGTITGTDYWMDEIGRRSRERSTQATNRLSRNSYALAVISTLIAVIALAVSVVTLIVSV